MRRRRVSARGGGWVGGRKEPPSREGSTMFPVGDGGERNERAVSRLPRSRMTRIAIASARASRSAFVPLWVSMITDTWPSSTTSPTSHPISTTSPTTPSGMLTWSLITGVSMAHVGSPRATAASSCEKRDDAGDARGRAAPGAANEAAAGGGTGVDARSSAPTAARAHRRSASRAGEVNIAARRAAGGLRRGACRSTLFVV